MATTANSQPSPANAWPGPFGLYKPSRNAVLRSLGTLVWIAVIAFVIALVISPIQQKAPVLGNVISLVVSAFFGAAQVGVLLSSVRGKRVELEPAMQIGQKFVVNMLLLTLLVGLSVAAGFILFIIPGLIILPRLALASYFMVDQNMGVMDSYKASWHAMAGHSLKFWGIVGVSVLMVLPVLTIIGIIATVYLVFTYQAAIVLLYEYVRRKSASK